jgi:hypothetical protein
MIDIKVQSPGLQSSFRRHAMMVAERQAFFIQRRARARVSIETARSRLSPQVQSWNIAVRHTVFYPEASACIHRPK